MKPWIKIDGKLNRRVLDRLLGAVLSHIMLKPGCTIFHLSQRFHPLAIFAAANIIAMKHLADTNFIRSVLHMMTYLLKTVLYFSNEFAICKASKQSAMLQATYAEHRQFRNNTTT